MSTNNNIPPLPSPSGPLEDEHYHKRMGALARHFLKFRAGVVAAIEELIVEMVGANDDLGSVKFRTQSGRNAQLVLAIGDTAVGRLTDAHNDLTDPPSAEKEE